ncbi:MAG: beta-glucosidase [Clostridia bacterium]|nr:beta-glucosidase [Clostridia bacterium]
MKFTFDWNAYAQTARKAVSEGCVLLENKDQTLPIKKGENVAVFGRIQFDYYKSGTGSGGMVNAPYVVSILDGLRNNQDISLNEDLINIYKDWCKDHPFDPGVGWAMEPFSQEEMPLDDETVKCAAKQSDLALIIIGRSAGEDKDSANEEGSYKLSKKECDMMEIVTRYFKRTAVILNVGSIMDMNWVDTYAPKAVMYVWQGGMEGGNGIADVLTGNVCPSGKLSDTIAYQIEDYPSTDCFGAPDYNEYREDIYVGYRYFESVAKEKVRYPFGYGLSYTRFDYQITDFSVNNNEVTISAQVSNVGDTAGKEVLQVYACPPQGKLAKPLRNLIRYDKTNTLKPGEMQILTFSIRMDELASYDDGGYTGHKSCYVLEPGNYQFYVGTDVREAVLAGACEQTELVVTRACKEACSPVRPFKRLKLKIADTAIHIAGYMEMEDVPLRTYDLKKRISENRPESVPYANNQGYQLIDVKNGKVSMETFLSQLTDEDLIYMSRGEGMCSSKVTPGIAGSFGGVTERLMSYGIPLAACADGPSGIRMDCGTKAFSLPNGTLLACSFNRKLVGELFEMEGKELRKNQIDTILGPGMNIHRNPLNGRNFEYFSEDPYLSGTMAATELLAMQKYGVTGTIKHFACNNQENSRQNVDSVVSERALREIYLAGYERCVKEASACCIMTTYAPLNGIFTGGNYDLLTTILHGEWNYQGVVMTDWWAKMNEEGEDGYRENTTMMIRAQNELYMVAGDAQENSNQDNAEEGLKKGLITRGELLRNAANICRTVMHLPAMEFFLQLKDEIEELNRPDDGKAEVDIMPAAVLDKEVFLNVENLKTEAGSRAQYAVKIPHRAVYSAHFKLKSDLNEYSQTSMTVALNNTIIGSTTVSGTKGEWIDYSFRFRAVVAIDHYLELYFGQSGMIVGEIKLKYEDELRDVFE